MIFIIIISRNLKSSIARDERHQLLDHQEEEESKPEQLEHDPLHEDLALPCYVEVPLGPEEPHVHLHLGVQVGHPYLGWALSLPYVDHQPTNCLLVLLL
jgi:hypothetical protein